MCLYPKKIINKKYTVTEKNGGNVPTPPIIGVDEFGYVKYDERVLYVNVDCGNCIECRKKKARDWQVRLNEEIKDYKYNYFITLTFSPAGLREIMFKAKIHECNAAAEYALRHALERYRKDFKKSIKHWFVTELGHEGTERIHMHGLLFTDTELEFEKIKRMDQGWQVKWKYWKYGFVFLGDWVNAQSVNYLVKYMNKVDEDHKDYKSQVLASPGIGRRYIEQIGKPTLHKYRPRATKDTYRLNNGAAVKLPKYYSNHFLNEDERELKWREYMDQEEVTIMGNNYSEHVGNDTLERITTKAQEENKFYGYGTDEKEWKVKDYNITRRMLTDEEKKERLEKMKNKIINLHFERTEPVNLEEYIELKKAGLKGSEINIIINKRGFNF